MRSFCWSLLFLVTTSCRIAAPAFAQESDPPYPVERGERVRVTLSPVDRERDAQGPFYIGSVFSADIDSLSLISGDGAASVRALAWLDIERVERVGENTTGEALGLLVGGAGGVLVGYALADILSESVLAGVGGAIYGGLGGLLIGGVVGSRVGDRWENVSPVRISNSFRVVVTTRITLPR